MNEKSVIIDFSNVKFVTRSFIDEFYNVLLNNKNSEITVELVNVSQDIQTVFDAVCQTQNKKKQASDQSSVVTFSNFAEVENYLKALPL